MRFSWLKGIFSFVVLSSATLVAVPWYDDPSPYNFYMATGFREDTVRMRIGAPEKFPSTYSLVKWKQLKIAQISASFDYSTIHNYYCRATADYGKILRGGGRVSNYLAVPFDPSSSASSSSSSSGNTNNTSSSSSSDDLFPLEFSRQSSESDRGNVADVSGALGWKVVSDGGRGWFAAVGGYSYHTQNLHMHHFDQKVALFNFIPTGSIPSLRSEYHTRWAGPFLGVDFSALVECNVTIFGSAEWHWARYEGNGHWKYVEDDYLAHIRQKANAYGAVGVLGFNWAPCDCWGFGLEGNYQNWSTKKGQNRAKVKRNGRPDSGFSHTFPVVEKSHLRRVKWTSFSISGLISYSY